MPRPPSYSTKKEEYKTGDAQAAADKVLAEANLPDQDVIEIYYRFMLTEHLEFSPDVQFVQNPTLDSNIDSLWYFQLRLRMTF